MEAPDGEGAVEAGAYVRDHPLRRALGELTRHEALVGNQLTLHCGTDSGAALRWDFSAERLGEERNGTTYSVVLCSMVLFKQKTAK